MDDVRAFFRTRRPVAPLVLPALSASFALYALNTLLATWQSVSASGSAGMRAPHMYAAAVIHLAFLVGTAGAPRRRARRRRARPGDSSGPSWTALGDGREARVTDLDLSRNADGSMRQASAALEVRQPDRPLERAVVSYNGPLSTGFGSDLFLLIRPTVLPAARLVRGDAQCVVGQEESCALGTVQVALLHLEAAGGGQGAMARVRVAREGASPQVFWLFQGRPQGARRRQRGEPRGCGATARRPAAAPHRPREPRGAARERVAGRRAAADVASVSPGALLCVTVVGAPPPAYRAQPR